MNKHSLLCDHCREFYSFLLDRDKFQEHVLLYDGKEQVPAQIFLFSKFCDSAISTEFCPLCNLILRAIGQDEHTENAKVETVKSETLTEVPKNLRIGPLELTVHRYGPSDETLKIHELGHSDETPVFYLDKIQITSTHDSDGLNGWLECRADGDSVAAKSGVIYRRPPLPSSSCEAAFSHVRKWLDNCLQNHVDCRKRMAGNTIDESLDPFLPTRVIDVRPNCPLDDMGVRLLESKGRRGQYVSLSHCWGPPNLRPLSTTQSTLQTNVKWISFSALPKTFQDAVVITREIGIRYLWIDSLCIIQDSKDDWFKESQAMGYVYETSRVMIAATSAANSSEGCFLSRPNFQFVELPYLNKSGDEQGSFMISEVYPPMAPSQEARPLFHRAWCLQEGIMARRILHYTNEGIWWSCKLPDQQVLDEMGDWSSIAIIRSTWDQLVISYTNRALTYHSDKLAALAGLVTELRKTKKGGYAQGLWTCDFPGNLLWIRLRSPMSRPEGQAFASWSWASTTGTMTWLSSCRELQNFNWNSLCESVSVVDSDTLSICCPVKQVHVVNEVVDAQEKYPQPLNSGGRLTAEQHFTYLCEPYYPMYEQNGIYIGIAALDDTVKSVPTNDLMCLVMIEEEPADDKYVDMTVSGRSSDWAIELWRRDGVPEIARAKYKRYFALLVEPIRVESGPPHHVRVGIGLIFNPDTLESLEVRNVTIK